MGLSLLIILAIPLFLVLMTWRHERRRRGGGLVDGVPRAQQESNWQE